MRSQSEGLVLTIVRVTKGLNASPLVLRHVSNHLHDAVTQPAVVLSVPVDCHRSKFLREAVIKGLLQAVQISTSAGEKVQQSSLNCHRFELESFPVEVR